MPEDHSANEEPKTTPGDIKIPSILPLLPVRDLVVFPYMIVPLVVGRERSVRSLDEALKGDRLVLLCAQRKGEVEDPSPDDINRVGTVSVILRMLKTQDGRAKILVQGLSRARVLEFVSSEPNYSVRIEPIPEAAPEPDPVRREALMRAVRENLSRAVQAGKSIQPDVLAMAENVEEPGRLADLVGSSLGLDLDEAQSLLETADAGDRLMRVQEALGKEISILEMQQRIQDLTKEELAKTQKEYFLRQQMRTIQQELGDRDEREQEASEFRAKISSAGMPADVKAEVEKQVARLSKMHPDSAEAATIRTYVEWMVEVPWKKGTKDRLDLARAEKVLDEDHYDLEKVKERILEYLGVLKLRKTLKGPILCFVGPPGVGKTSLGRSIARAMGRKFVRMSLGGVRDEAEIRGHRRTYVGALPGRIIQGIKQAGSRNPVFMLDEIDKLGADFRGDPSSALLEVLDPEQNSAFRDHYLAVPYDLSEAMFITTANLADPIPSPLLDRMEVLRLSGYTAVEKFHIARRYLIPRQMERNGISPKLLSISDGALERVILEYTREAGVRNLEREIGSLCRKVARKAAQGQRSRSVVTARNLERFLGVARFAEADARREPQVGVAMGLAWTPVGGEILNIEVSAVKGRGSLTMTGSLGDVMKESAQAALTYIRSRADVLGLSGDSSGEKDIHVHVPAGAIPKDGPSAGVALAAAMISALTGRPPRPDVAMTGEITLTGRVLPVGGLREKLLAARRAGVKRVVIPEKNRPDLSEIPSYVLRGIELVPVGSMDEAARAVFPPAPRRPGHRTRPVARGVAKAGGRVRA